jgi:hypothetical protein
MRILIANIILTALLYSCNNKATDCENYTYDCNTQEPYEWEMNIEVSLNNQNKQIPIWIYEGKFNDTSHLVYTDTLTESSTSVYLPLNKYYYTKAKYQQNGKTIYAIDGVFFKKYSRSVCDSTCWYIKNENMDVRLK